MVGGERVLLTETEIELILSSAKKMATMNVEATNTFYSNLFNEAWDLRLLFPEDMFEQSRKLWDTIGVLLESLDKLDELAPALQALGARHVDYGVIAEHYQPVSDVLVYTIADIYGPGWTEAHAAAWHKVLSWTSGQMMAGAQARAA